MSKFTRVTEGKFVKVAQQQNAFLKAIDESNKPYQFPTQANPSAGNAPVDMFSAKAQVQGPVNPAIQGPVKPQVQGPVAPVKNAPATQVNYFAKAGIIDPKQYTGTADQNEKLRQAIDPSARTFYDAYVNKFGKWAQHPSERIDKLSGGTPGVKPISSTPSAPVANSQFPPNAAAPGVPNTGTPPSATPSGFTRTKSGLLLPPLPR